MPVFIFWVKSGHRVKILKKNGQESLSVHFLSKNWTPAVFRPNNDKFLDSQRFLVQFNASNLKTLNSISALHLKNIVSLRLGGQNQISCISCSLLRSGLLIEIPDLPGIWLRRSLLLSLNLYSLSNLIQTQKRPAYSCRPSSHSTYDYLCKHVTRRIQLPKHNIRHRYHYIGNQRIHRSRKS